MSKRQHAKTAQTGARQDGVGGRVERRRRRTPGDMAALQRELWHALRRIGEVLDQPNADAADLCRAGHTLAALANSYRAVTAEHDFERELADLRRELYEATAALGRAAGARAVTRAAQHN